jgi:hypothetical protein
VVTQGGEKTERGFEQVERSGHKSKGKIRKTTHPLLDSMLPNIKSLFVTHRELLKNKGHAKSYNVQH